MTFDIYYQHKIKNYFRHYWGALTFFVVDSVLAKMLFNIYAKKMESVWDFSFGTLCAFVAAASLFVAAFGAYKSFFAKNKSL